MPERFLRRGRAVLAAGAAFVLLGACAPRATLIADPVFSELYLRQQEPRERLEIAAGDAGYRLEQVTLEEMPPPPGALSAALSEARDAGPVVLSPFLAGTARQVTSPAAGGEDGGPVLLLGTPGADGVGGGQAAATVVTFDRRASFQLLGRRFAEVLEDAGEDGRALVYGLADGADRDAELEAMREGLGASAAATRFVLFDAPGEEAAVREELFRLRGPDVVAIGAFAGPWNSLLLDEVAGLDRVRLPVVATEDIGPGGAYGGLAQYHVERDFAAAVGRFLSGERGAISADSQLVGGDGAGTNRVR